MKYATRWEGNAPRFDPTIPSSLKQAAIGERSLPELPRRKTAQRKRKQIMCLLSQDKRIHRTDAPCDNSLNHRSATEFFEFEENRAATAKRTRKVTQQREGEIVTAPSLPYRRSRISIRAENTAPLHSSQDGMELTLPMIQNQQRPSSIGGEMNEKAVESNSKL